MRNWKVPLLLFFLCLISFGIQIPRVGLYGDDWQYMYVYHLLGAGEYPNFVAADRPLSAWIYMMVTPLLGENIWGYQVLVMVIRWLGSIGCWWVFRQIWADKPRLALWVAALFVIYPSFKQQWLPLEFILHFTVLALYFLSLGLMIQSVTKSSKYWILTIAGVIASTGMFSIEYFVGLELLRPALLWMVQKNKKPQSKFIGIWFVLRYWTPYLVVLILFLIWRVFIYRFQYYEPKLINSLLSNPIKAIFSLVWRVVGDLILVSISTWQQAWQTLSGVKPIILYVAIMIIVFVILGFFLRKISIGEDDFSKIEGISIRSAVQSLGLGGLAMLMGGLPFWVMDIPLWIKFPWDRSTLPLMLGASLIIAGAVELIIQPRFRQPVIAVLLTLAFGIHFQTANVYNSEWRDLKNFLWQLSWRAPAIEKNTILLTDTLPFNYYGDNSLSPALNWTYAPGLAIREIPYRMFDLNIRMGSFFPTLGRDMPVTHNYRSFRFSGSTSNMIVTYYNPPACLRILNPQSNILIPDMPSRLADAAYLSRLDLISTEVDSPARPPSIMGNEPEHDWCYYFEKAELAGQDGNWQIVVALADEANNKSLKPSELSEWIIFIEGYAYTHSLERAILLSEEANQNASRSLKMALCEAWKNIERERDFSVLEKSMIGSEMEKLDCGIE